MAKGQGDINGWLRLEIVLANIVKGLTKQLFTRIWATYDLLYPQSEIFEHWATVVSSCPTNHMLPSYQVNYCLLVLSSVTFQWFFIRACSDSTVQKRLSICVTIKNDCLVHPLKEWCCLHNK